MKLGFTLSALFLLVAVATAQAKPGFRDAEWNMSPQPGMVIHHVEQSVTFYSRATDKLTIGDARLASILYGYFNNHLYAVILHTENGQDTALLAVLKQSWGAGSQPNQFIESYLWPSGDTLAGYDRNQFTHVATVLIFSTVTYKQVAAANAAIAAKGKKDL
jgi:hypothetical protein